MLKLLTAAALAVSSLSAATFAEDRTSDVKVSYRDLDLRDAGAVRTLDRRLNHAIATACGDDGSVRELSRIRAVQSCKAARRVELDAARDAAIAAMTRSGPLIGAAR